WRRKAWCGATGRFERPGPSSIHATTDVSSLERSSPAASSSMSSAAALQSYFWSASKKLAGDGCRIGRVVSHKHSGCWTAHALVGTDTVARSYRPSSPKLRNSLSPVCPGSFQKYIAGRDGDDVGRTCGQ